MLTEHVGCVDVALWCLLQVSAVNAVFLTLYYWVLGFDPHASPNVFNTPSTYYGFTTVSMHGLNVVLVLLEVCLNRLPFVPLFAGVQTVSLVLYVSFMLVWNVVQEGRNVLPPFYDGLNGEDSSFYQVVWTYPALDYNSELGWIMVLALIVLSTIINGVFYFIDAKWRCCAFGNRSLKQLG